MTNVQALFVDARGIYPRFLGPENCWSIERDATLYTGTAPVVAHPPCQLWTNFAAVNWGRYKRELPAWYDGGSDGGLFEFALKTIARCGGVLEHPANSHAFKHYGLPKPEPRQWRRVAPPTAELFALLRGKRMYVTSVRQAAYGHRATKETWLVFCGSATPPPLDWRQVDGTHQIGWFDRKKPTLGKREANATPQAFAELLIYLASVYA